MSKKQPAPQEEHRVNATFFENGDIRFKCSICPKTWISYYVQGRRIIVLTKPGSNAPHIGGGAGFPLKKMSVDFDTLEVKQDG